MRKFLKLLCLLLVMAVCFLLGWRVMPKVWPTLKTQVVYRVLPQLQPVPTPLVTPTPYQPKSSGTVDDPIGVMDSLIYYFYRPTCPHCERIEPLMSALPQVITLPDGRQSRVLLIPVNKSDEHEGILIAQFYESQNLPQEEWYVPAVVIGERYLMPGSEIIDQLLDALLAGEGLATPLLDGAQRE